MPKRNDIHKILLIGSGPIVIGQACEFDYSGTQACKALREEGFKVVLVNSNPATIMTDPEFADRTYIEPITPEVVEKIIEREKPDALLPTVGGQTALNVAVAVAARGVLARHGVEMIGANEHVIRKAEERELFRDAMRSIGLDLPRSVCVGSVEEARAGADELGLPLVIRPSFTLGGTGGGIAYNREEFEEIVTRGLEYSPVTEVLVEESVLGWKEFELEVMRDLNDNVVIVCSIENVDPMGVHTGDSITVAPAQTLTDKEYQRMRDAAIAVIREIGVETGGANIQFAIHPDTGRMVVIEMNPRVSRSSALASKATGFPIAKIAAKLAVGYTLDEIPNDITRETPASFEPTIDYCVVKAPRFAFEKFPGADPTLTTQMKSVGEAMSIGRTFKEALQKALRSLEIGRFGLGADGRDTDDTPPIETIRAKLITPNADRIFFLRTAIRAGMSLQEIARHTRIDPWFLENIAEIVELEDELRACRSADELAAQPDLFRRAKQNGFSDVQLAYITRSTETTIREMRYRTGLRPTYRLVDTCAAEFEAYTPYFYSSYGDETEIRPGKRRKIMILGGGPNRIGQGIEFDYCCVHASFALKEDGFETIMVNSNPETVSTDYDTSDRLYFEPLTLEDVLHIYEAEECWGAIVQFGGQTPLNLAVGLEKAGVNIIGTGPDSIDRAEDRRRFQELLDLLGLRQAPNGTARDAEAALAIASRIGYPILVRPSRVLGGRKMAIIYDADHLHNYVARQPWTDEELPILIDRFLEDATEVDVDCIADGEIVVVGAVMEHIEQAGVHSGDSACTIPPYSLAADVVEEICRQTHALARELGVRGLMNVQYAVKNRQVYVLEANPRASRTIPYVSKTIGVPLAKLAARVMAGKTLRELAFTAPVHPPYYTVKEAVLPFARFHGVDILLGPEMKSTGEVMGIGDDIGVAYAKTQMAAGVALPEGGRVFISVRDSDKQAVVRTAAAFVGLGFEIVSTVGTGDVLRAHDIPVTPLLKVSEGRPNVLDMIKNGEIRFIINTPSGSTPRQDEIRIRSSAVGHGIPVMTTLAGAEAAVRGIESLRRHGLTVRSIQEYHADLPHPPLRLEGGACPRPRSGAL